MNTTDYATWLTKRQAADTLGVSTRTLEQLAKAGELQHTRWKRPTGGMPITVYAPDDVERIARARQPSKAFVMPDAAAPPIRELARTSQSDDVVARFFEVIGKARARKWVLTIEEAAVESGWPVLFLRRAIKDGRLPATKHGRWLIRRQDLMALPASNGPQTD